MLHLIGSLRSFWPSTLKPSLILTETFLFHPTFLLFPRTSCSHKKKSQPPSSLSLKPHHLVGLEPPLLICWNSSASRVPRKIQDSPPHSLRPSTNSLKGRLLLTWLNGSPRHPSHPSSNVTMAFAPLLSEKHYVAWWGRYGCVDYENAHPNFSDPIKLVCAYLAPVRPSSTAQDGPSYNTETPCAQICLHEDIAD